MLLLRFDFRRSLRQRAIRDKTALNVKKNQVHCFNFRRINNIQIVDGREYLDFCFGAISVVDEFKPCRKLRKRRLKVWMINEVPRTSKHIQ